MDLSYKRIAAAFIDFILFIIVYSVILISLLILFATTLSDEILYETMKGAFDYGMVFMLFFMYAYYVYADYYLKGSGVGKKIVDIQIRRKAVI